MTDQGGGKHQPVVALANWVRCIATQGRHPPRILFAAGFVGLRHQANWYASLSYRRRERRGGRHLFILGVDIHNPYTFNDVSAYATGGQIFRPANVKRAEVITKRIRSPTALRKVFRPDIYFSVRQNLIYSSYRTRGWKYQPTPHIDRKKRQRSKDYQPQNGSRLCRANQARASLNS